MPFFHASASSFFQGLNIRLGPVAYERQIQQRDLPKPFLAYMPDTELLSSPIGTLCVLFLLHTYLLTPWSTLLLEKLTGFQLVMKFPTFYETRTFITAVTSARYLSLS